MRSGPTVIATVYRKIINHRARARARSVLARRKVARRSLPRVNLIFLRIIFTDETKDRGYAA